MIVAAAQTIPVKGDIEANLEKHMTLSLGIAIGSVIVDLLKGTRDVSEIALKCIAMFVITLLLYTLLDKAKTNRPGEDDVS